MDLIKILVAGNETLEGELADLLIQDLERLSHHRDMDFVNKVFIPLIKVEKVLPVTLSPARTTTESGQPALLPGPSALEENDESQDADQATFFNTELLQQKEKQYLKAAFQQIIGGKQSQAQVEKYFNSKWSKVHQWNSKKDGQNPEHLTELGLWKQLENRGPCLLITRVKTISGK